MECKDIDEMLISYLDGELTNEEKEVVELHLSTCPRCRRELEMLSATQYRLRQSFAARASKAPSPRAWAGLQQRLVAEEQSKVAVFSVARAKLGKIKGRLSSRQPMWKSALAGALVVALIAGLVLIVPSHFGQSQEVLAAEIARNDPQVHEMLPEGTTVKITKIMKPREGDIFHALFLIPGGSIWGGEDEGEVIMIDALVNVRERKVVGLRAIKSRETPITPLSVAERKKAVEIAKADSRVQEILDGGAEIRRVIPLPFFKPADSSLTVKVVGVILTAPLSNSQAEVAPKPRVQRWIVVVNLDEGKVVELIGATR